MHTSMSEIRFARPLRLAAASLTGAALLLLLATGTRADPERGRLLYENHCTVCHESVVHVREERKSTSRDDVEAWVRRWQQQLNLQWGNSEVDDVIEFLNDRYYGFKSES